jgi:hypothetical protein
VRDRVECGVHVGEHALVGRLHDQLPPGLHVRVGQVDVALDAVE